MTSQAESERWLLSFYRHSEIAGSLFFGRIADSMKAGPLQADVTRHYADEAAHAQLWTQCMAELGIEPLRIRTSYQEQYLTRGGLPVNMMEVMAVTLVFERRVSAQYGLHRKLVAQSRPAIARTLDRIAQDEKWHISYVAATLDGMRDRYGADAVKSTIDRYSAADREIYEHMVREHEERLADIVLPK